MSRFNDWLAEKITNAVGSMACAYFFSGLAIIGFPYGSTDIRLLVQWFAQTFLQLVLLSVILVGQKLQSKRHEDIKQDIAKVHKHLNIE